VKNIFERIDAMLTKIKEGIYTAAYVDLESIKPDLNFSISQVVDVRLLVDKEGNDISEILRFAENAKKIFLEQGLVIIACDMGVSRSRVVAMALLELLGESIDVAIERVMESCGNPAINCDLIQLLRRHFEPPNNRTTHGINGSVAVIGSRGFVGTSLSAGLRSKGVEIVELNRSNVNLDDVFSLVRIFEKMPAERVVFAVNQKSFHSTWAFSESLKLLKNTLEGCRYTAKKLIFLSSMNVFVGNARMLDVIDYYVDEGEEPFPYGNYSESKFFAEKLIEIYAKNYGVEYAILRPSGLYGLGIRKEWMISRFIDMAMRGERIVTHRYRNGLPAFEFLHIDDFVSAFYLLFLERKAKVRDIKVNIGTGELVTTFDLAKRISRLMDVNLDVGQQGISSYAYNVGTTTGMLKRLGWQPVIDFDDGLREVADSMR
jgi:nucleoside-diphosphate-sugar epimerase